jgi:hypothetical protein
MIALLLPMVLMPPQGFDNDMVIALQEKLGRMIPPPQDPQDEDVTIQGEPPHDAQLLYG